ncbi:Uma2 family endonuclease [Mesorhizobium sp. IMUNJ 23232]|uniref:Uma2 family endonuclease n=1 Tax=Mesorhizobium sp. IMUNJ 23232 TaxID=3376064 RepID=UPI003788BAEC
MRRRWTVAEIEAATRAGIIDKDERFELIGGELVPMDAKGLHHELLKNALSYHLVRNTSEEFRVAVATTFRLSEDSFVEPDFIFFRKADGLANLNPRTALLAVEIADSSLKWDLGRKARIYANFGVPELWVVEAVSRVVHVHRRPALEGYDEIVRFSEDQTLVSQAVPGLAVTLAELEEI